MYAIPISNAPFILILHEYFVQLKPTAPPWRYSLGSAQTNHIRRLRAYRRIRKLVSLNGLHKIHLADIYLALLKSQIVLHKILYAFVCKILKSPNRRRKQHQTHFPKIFLLWRFGSLRYATYIDERLVGGQRGRYTGLECAI